MLATICRQEWDVSWTEKAVGSSGRRRTYLAVLVEGKRGHAADPVALHELPRDFVHVHKVKRDRLELLEVKLLHLWLQIGAFAAPLGYLQGAARG